jgi:hypothetical protein
MISQFGGLAACINEFQSGVGARARARDRRDGGRGAHGAITRNGGGNSHTKRCCFGTGGPSDTMQPSAMSRGGGSEEGDALAVPPPPWQQQQQRRPPAHVHLSSATANQLCP